MKFTRVFFFAIGSYEPVFKSSCQLLISAWDVKNCAGTEHRGMCYKGVRESFFEYYYPLMRGNIGKGQGSLSRLDLSRNSSTGSIL